MPPNRSTLQEDLAGPLAPQASEATEPPCVSIVLRPRCLLTGTTAARFFAGTCAITFVVAGVAAVQGAWPALPFAALEMGILYLALRSSLERGRDYERVEIFDQQIRIRVCVRDVCTETCFLRHWARVRLLAADSRLHPKRLLIECQGRRCELGTFLTEPERAETAAQLRRLIGAIGESPRLEERSRPAALPL